MKKLVVVALVAALGLGAMGTAPAEAGGWGHHRHGGHHGHWSCGDVIFGAVAAVTGLALLDAVLSPPRVVYTQPAVVYSPPPVAYTPPPVVYAPPPVVYTAPVVLPPVCRPMHVPPRVIYQRPAYCPAPRPMYPYGGYWRR
jgi:hypothetical protein